MKIAHILAFYTPAIGGVKQVVEEISKAQIAAGHEVHVYCSDWDKFKRIKKQEEIINGVHVHRCFHYVKVANFESIWPSVFPKLMKENFDIIHTHVYGHVYFVLAALASKIKNTVHIHTTHCPWTDAHRSMVGRLGVWASYNTLSRWALKNTNRIIAITPWEYDFLKKFGATEDQIINLPNGMEEGFFKKISNNDFKKKHKIKGKMVLFFGRLNVTKAPDKFVEIAKKILEKHKDTTFVIVGPDEGLESKVKGMIANEPQIKFLGPIYDRKEVFKMYQSSDVFVLPSFREGLPLTLFEAMATGLPVVASPVNGIPYEMKEPENGFLVKFGDVEGFTKRISQFLDDKNLCQKVSKNNLETAKKYQWDLIGEKTLKIYEEELEKNEIR
tara:strand:+ start:1291 stop:2448 length:1158 start_codon:yes stop_codon:yes gene_type:complete